MTRWRYIECGTAVMMLLFSITYAAVGEWGTAGWAFVATLWCVNAIVRAATAEPLIDGLIAALRDRAR